MTTRSRRFSSTKTKIFTDGVIHTRGDSKADVVDDSTIVSWRGVELEGAFGFSEDFLANAGDTLPTPWAVQDTSAVGTPTKDYAGAGALTDGAGGFILALATDNEQESLTLYHGDNLFIPITKKPYFECRVQISPDVSGSATDLSAGDILVFGLASARNATLDNIATNVWFRMEGANNNILIEGDDGTTDTDDVDSGIDWSIDTWVTLAIDCEDLSAVKFYIDGVQVSTTIDISAATGYVQPFIEVSKAAAVDNDHKVSIDYVEAKAVRG